MDFFEVLLSDEDSKKEEKKTEEEPKIINSILFYKLFFDINFRFSFHIYINFTSSNSDTISIFQFIT